MTRLLLNLQTQSYLDSRIKRKVSKIEIEWKFRRSLIYTVVGWNVESNIKTVGI